MTLFVTQFPNIDSFLYVKIPYKSKVFQHLKNVKNATSKILVAKQICIFVWVCIFIYNLNICLRSFGISNTFRVFISPRSFEFQSVSKRNDYKFFYAAYSWPESTWSTIPPNHCFASGVTGGVKKIKPSILLFLILIFINFITVISIISYYSSNLLFQNYCFILIN